MNATNAGNGDYFLMGNAQCGLSDTPPPIYGNIVFLILLILAALLGLYLLVKMFQISWPPGSPRYHARWLYCSAYISFLSGFLLWMLYFVDLNALDRWSNDQGRILFFYAKLNMTCVITDSYVQKVDAAMGQAYTIATAIVIVAFLCIAVSAILAWFPYYRRYLNSWLRMARPRHNAAQR